MCFYAFKELIDMGSSVVKSFISILVLIIFSFYIGNSLVEDAKSAAAIIVAVVGIAAMIVVGKHAWILMYLGFCFLSHFQLLPSIPIPYFLSISVLIYWFLLRLLGHVRFTWYKMFWMDFFVFLSFAYTVFMYCRHPAGISFLAQFGIDTDYIGGKSYFLALFSFLSYLSYSCVKYDKDKFLPVLKWYVYVYIAAAIFACMRGLIAGASAAEEANQSMLEGRFGMLSPLALCILLLVYGQYSWRHIITSSKLLFLIALSALLGVMTGWRGHFLTYALVVFTCAIIKREIMFIMTCVGLGFITVLGLSESGALKHMPYGVQRSLSTLSFVKIAPDIRRSAESSSNWRIVMWEWALDPRMGYIKDYIWGDGDGLQAASHYRLQRAVMRREVSAGGQERFAQTRVWHSGFISMLHVAGVVGLSIFFMTQAYCAIMSIVVCRSLRGSPYFVYAVFILGKCLATVIVFYVSAGSFAGYSGIFYTAVFLKIFYNIAVQEGYYVPLLQRKRYVPLMIREDQSHNPQARIAA